MDADSAKNLLEILIENSRRILRAGFGVNAAESTFFDIIGLIRSNPGLREDFLEKVRITLAVPDPGRLDAGMVPRELIELATHELQWDEIRGLAEKRIQKFFGGSTSLAVGDIASSIVEAYGRDWRDREFYSRYKD